MTRDELIGKVAERLDGINRDGTVCCPQLTLNLEESDDCKNCSLCWATAIVNLVKGEEERG